MNVSFIYRNYLFDTPFSQFVEQVEAGDIIVKVNETDVHRFTTKEGLSISPLCLSIIIELAVMDILM